MTKPEERGQTQLVKTFWEQAKQSAALAHQCWALYSSSYRVLKDSYIRAGFAHADAIKELDGAMDAYEQQYKAAWEHLLKMEALYKEVLDEVERTNQ